MHTKHNVACHWAASASKKDGVWTAARDLYVPNTHPSKEKMQIKRGMATNLAPPTARHLQQYARARARESKLSFWLVKPLLESLVSLIDTVRTCTSWSTCLCRLFGTFRCNFTTAPATALNSVDIDPTLTQQGWLRCRTDIPVHLTWIGLEKAKRAELVWENETQ
eukprot:5329943-Amphidinium_carterae.2